jgi:hypothetical protein
LDRYSAVTHANPASNSNLKPLVAALLMWYYLNNDNWGKDRAYDPLTSVKVPQWAVWHIDTRNFTSRKESFEW